MPQMLISIFVFLFSLTLFAEEYTRLDETTAHEAAEVFLEFFTGRIDAAQKSHPEISELDEESVNKFAIVDSDKGSIQNEDVELKAILQEILTIDSDIKSYKVESIKERVLEWVKTKYSECTINGIVYAYSENNSLSKEKCSFTDYYEKSLREARGRNALSRIKNPEGIDIKELIASWKSIEEELGGLDYNFIFPKIVKKAPLLKELKSLFHEFEEQKELLFICSEANAITYFFDELKYYYNEYPFDSIISQIKLPSILNAYYFNSEDELTKTITHTLLLLDQHNQIYGLEVTVTRVN